LLLKNKLQTLRMSEEESTSTYLNKVQDIINQLAAIGEHIPEDQLVLQILASLPESWENMTRNLACRAATPSFADLSTLMMQEELFMEMRGDKKAATEGLFTYVHRTTNRPPLTSGSLAPRRGGFNCSRAPRGCGRFNSFIPRQEEHKKDARKGNCTFCGSPHHWMR
jgi:hypothetical protein